MIDPGRDQVRLGVIYSYTVTCVALYFDAKVAVK